MASEQGPELGPSLKRPCATIHPPQNHRRALGYEVGRSGGRRKARGLEDHRVWANICLIPRANMYPNLHRPQGPQPAPATGRHVVIIPAHEHTHSQCHVHAHADSHSLTHKHSHDGQGLVHAVSLRNAHPPGSPWFGPPLRWHPWTLSLRGPPPHHLPYSVISFVHLLLLLPISPSLHGAHESRHLFNPLTLGPGVAGGPQ